MSRQPSSFPPCLYAVDGGVCRNYQCQICYNCKPGRNGQCENQPSNSDGSCSASQERVMLYFRGRRDISEHPMRTPLLWNRTHPNYHRICLITSRPMIPPLRGPLDGATTTQQILACYDEAVSWRRTIFKVPSGKSGSLFVKELARPLVRSPLWSQSSRLHTTTNTDATKTQQQI